MKIKLLIASLFLMAGAAFGQGQFTGAGGNISGTGNITPGHCASFASASTIQDAGAACGSGTGNVTGSGITTGVKGELMAATGVANTIGPTVAIIDGASYCLPYTQWTDIGTCMNQVTTAFPNGNISFQGLTISPFKYYINTPIITPANYQITAAGNASGGSTVYTGTFIAAPSLAGYTIGITGFANGANNGSFVISASTLTTITVNNAGGVSQSGQTAFGGLSGIFSGTVWLPNAVFFANTVAGFQSFGGGIVVHGGGRTNFAAPQPYSGGTGTDFEACSSTDDGSDFTGPCASTAYSATITNDTNNYPAIISLNAYPPTSGAVGASGTTIFGSRVDGVSAGGGMLSNVTLFGNYAAQEQSKFDNIQGHDWSGSGSICIQLGGGTGGAQNSWTTDAQCSVLAGKTNTASAVGVQVWAGTGNGLHAILERVSVVNNAGGTLPNYDFQFVGGTTNVGEIVMIGNHAESAGIDGYALGVVTVKGVDQGGAANGMMFIDSNCGPGFTGGGASGCFHIYNGTIGAGTAAVTNIQFLASGSTNATPVNLITDANNTSIPVATKFIDRYETNGSGKVVSDTSGTNVSNFAGGIFATSYAGNPVVIQPTVDSTTSVTLKNAGGTAQFQFDTTNGRFGIGSGAPSASFSIGANFAINSSGLVTGYGGTGTVARGLPSVYGIDNVTGSSATRTAQNILSSTPRAGQYAVHWYIDQNAPCTTSPGTVTVAINWTDVTAARASGTIGTLTFTTSGSSTTAFAQGVFNLWAANATAITDTETYTACGTGTSTYDFHAYVTEAQ